MYRSRQYTVVNCKKCGKELKIRNDYLSKHTKFCPSCRTKDAWVNNKVYREKCISSHKGHIPGNRLPYMEASLRNLYSTYKSSAKKRKVDFSIDIEYFRIITKENCFYCNASPSLTPAADKSARVYGSWVYNGIDRKDSIKGYTVENCLPCCATCNYAKQSLGINEFIEHITKIYDNINSKIIV